MEKEHYGFCGFCGSELSGRTEEHAEGVTQFLKCESCHKLWQLLFCADMPQYVTCNFFIISKPEFSKKHPFDSFDYLCSSKVRTAITDMFAK